MRSPLNNELLLSCFSAVQSVQLIHAGCIYTVPDICCTLPYWSGNSAGSAKCCALGICVRFCIFDRNALLSCLFVLMFFVVDPDIQGGRQFTECNLLSAIY